ncbi:MAG: glycoside hydrolase family 16 protein [Phycisphaerales bacterium]|nr:glycoside hydrolase family 16 protein [Phycisphaerales bacterium]
MSKPLICSILGIGALTGVASSDTLIMSDHFDQGLSAWTASGDVELELVGGWSSPSYVRMMPSLGNTAQLQRTIHGLLPRTRYTVASRIRTTDRLAPPIISIGDGAQIHKAHGWVAMDDTDRWLERRFEVFTDDAASSLTITLQAWQTDLDVVIDFDDVRLYQGRLDGPPPVDPGQPEWLLPPMVTAAPHAGDQLVVNGDFSQSTTGWSLGLNAEVVDEDGASMRLTSTADTARCAQPIALGLPPRSTWQITCHAKVDDGVIASMYVESASGFSSSVPISNTDWQQITLTVTTGEDWVEAPTLKLENWKNQPGAAWFKNISWNALGTEWAPTLALDPEPQIDPMHETFETGLNRDHWLISCKAWGGDNGGVSPSNVSIVDDWDNGEPIKALRLEAHGDLYDGDVMENGRSTRVGSAIATRQYYASGRYTVRAKVAPELGAVTAFWPFHYIDYHTAEPGYWHEPNPRRNTEIDWEFPTDLKGTGEDAAAAYGLDPSEIAFTNARTNAWGGQFGGEGGEHKGRIVLRDANEELVNLVEDYQAGIYHDYIIEWHSGEFVVDDAGDARIEPGCVRWYFDDVLVDELTDVAFGQGNVPYRGARFWLGVWFAAAGYADEVGWGGSPNFDTTATHIASVSIEPFNDPRDTWVRETVPNLAWATPDRYPESPCAFDLNEDGDVGTLDLLIMLESWTDYDVDNLLSLLTSWGPCNVR